MWNDAAVCGGRIQLNFLLVSGMTCGNPVRGNLLMLFSIPLVCFEYRYVSLLTSVHKVQHATASWDSALTGSKYSFFIQASALELSINAKMCDLCPI